VTVKTCQWSDPHCQDDCRLSEYVFAKIAIEDMGSYEYSGQALSTKNWKNWLGLLSRKFWVTYMNGVSSSFLYRFELSFPTIWT
jgi:hypothetical protein